MKKLTILVLVLAIVAVGRHEARAALVQVDSAQTTPYAVSSSDLLQTSLAGPPTSTGNFTQEGAGGVPVLNDGAFGVLAAGSFSGAATGGNGGGTQVIYTLDTSAAPGGYDITGIDTYTGWQDAGRNDQSYTVAYSTISAPTVYRDIATVSYNSGVGNPSATYVGLSDNAGVLASNVRALRFKFNNVENGYTGYRELDALGAASSGPLPPAPSFAATATNDWGAEIQPGSYTHAVNFGRSSPTVNGVSFEAAGTGGFTNGNTTYSNAWTGTDPNNVTGHNGLADEFLNDGDTTADINLTGLVAGQEYLFKAFFVGWNNSDRTTTIVDLDTPQGLTFDPDLNGPGADNGTVVSYLYTAQPDGELNLRLTFANNQSPHLYALTNQVNPEIPEPATMALLGLAACALGGYVRRRRMA